MLKLWSSALGLEALALALLTTRQDAWVIISGYLLLHAGASVLVALACSQLFPAAYRKPRHLVLALLFCFNFFVPIVGLVILLVAVVAGSLFPQLLKPRVFDAVLRPEFTVTDEEPQALRGTAARARLFNRAASSSAREEALLALAATGAAGSGGLLRDLLADPSDDLRLLAYGMIDRREKEVSGRLAAERRLLQMAEGVDDRDAARAVCGRIAHLYWELVYQGLALGDTARFALEQALIFAERSLDDSPRDGPTWLMIGRVRMLRGELRAAEAALNEALTYQVPRRTVIPYLAELRFLQRRFADVRRLMFELGGQQGSTTLTALQDYWAA
jgi:tetratricopeptide (TPR) repeat protein